jgi:hypothetical protein
MTANPAATSQPGRGPADGQGATAAPADVFGRRAELSEIQRFLASPGTTLGALVLEGEAGIGKTTLWRHGVAGARERSWRVLSCAPARSEVSLSFAALADLLSEALDEVGPSLPAPQRRGLRVALALEESSEAPAADQRTIAAGFLGVLRGLAATD